MPFSSVEDADKTAGTVTVAKCLTQSLSVLEQLKSLSISGDMLSAEVPGWLEVCWLDPTDSLL